MENKQYECDEKSIERIIDRFDGICIKKEEIKPKKYKSRIGKLILVTTIMITGSVSVLAQTGIIDLEAILTKAYESLFQDKEMAQSVKNQSELVNYCSTYQGIEANILSYVRDRDMFYLTFTLEDLEKERIDDTTFIYSYGYKLYQNKQRFLEDAGYGFDYDVNILALSSNRETQGIKLLSYNEITKQALFGYSEFITDDNENVFPKYLELNINQIASGMEEGEMLLDVALILEGHKNPRTIEASPDDFRREGKGERQMTFLEPDELAVRIEKVPYVAISNVGIIDGRLHVLVKYEKSQDVSINRILGMKLNNSNREWDEEAEAYLTPEGYWPTECNFKFNGCYYTEYIYDIPENYKAEDIELLYRYRIYDNIIGASNNLYLKKGGNNLWRLELKPTATLEEKIVPLTIRRGNTEVQVEAYLSELGISADENISDEQVGSYLIAHFEDGSRKIIEQDKIQTIGHRYASGRIRDKIIFKEYVDISKIVGFTRVYNKD